MIRVQKVADIVDNCVVFSTRSSIKPGDVAAALTNLRPCKDPISAEIWSMQLWIGEGAAGRSVTIDLPPILSIDDPLDQPKFIVDVIPGSGPNILMVYFRDRLFTPERLPVNATELEEIALRVKKVTYEDDSDVSGLRAAVSNLEGAISPLRSAAPYLPERPLDLNAMLTELDSLIGLTAVKNQVHSLINLVKVRHLRVKQGMSVPDVSLHMVFAGNPGTGKTTVARLIANIYAQIGVLRRGQLIEVDRSGLVAGFIGQTAIKTKEVIQRSLDGVLFIDEAYSLAERGNQDFGNEAIETLLKEMEDNRGRLIVIVAGYTTKMSAFIDSNPGLKSRFSRVIEFQNYTATELLLIADHMAKQHSFQFEHDARDALGHTLSERCNQSEVQFGNARGVRNLFEAIMDAQANRIVNLESPSRQDLQTIKLNDVVSAVH